MICLDDGTDNTVGLIDISAGGVAVAVSADSPLSVANGDKVTVKFESDRLGTPLQISSHIRRIKFSSDKKSIMYGVLFDTWTDKRLNLTPKLRSLFNEREAVRVEPREDEEIDVHLVVNGEERIVRGLLRDISVSGVGVWLNDDEDSKACTDPQISVDLTLPDDASYVRLAVEVRYVQEVGDRSRVGMRFADNDPKIERAQYKYITNYVMTRQIEIARIDAERRRAMESHYPTR